jgi:hypothetical protein
MFSAAALRRQLLCNLLFVQLVFYPWSPSVERKTAGQRSQMELKKAAKKPRWLWTAADSQKYPTSSLSFSSFVKPFYPLDIRNK